MKLALIAGVRDYLGRQTLRGRATRFASRLFPGCPTHQEEARGVHRLVEQLCGHRLEDLHADTALEEILGSPSSLSFRRLRIPEVMEVVAALEREMVQSEPPREPQPPADAAARILGLALLGPARARSTWDPPTVWQRSVRGIVNERVRWRTGCTCGAETTRPTAPPADRRCSFCNKGNKDVRKLIAGPTVYICDECVNVCLQILHDDRQAGHTAAATALEPGSRPTERPWPSSDAWCAFCGDVADLERALMIENRTLLCEACVASIAQAAAEARKE